jgi:dTMP kinase
MPGKLIIIEGIDGSGTTTQSKLLAQKLKFLGIKTQLTFEPYNKNIIKIIKDSSSSLADLFLFLADRSEHYLKIKKWLTNNRWVISDRSFPSTLVYQWYTTSLKKQLSLNFILTLNNLSMFNIQPDLIFILDVKPTIALERLKKKKKKSLVDKYEKLHIMKKLSQGYRYLAHKYRWHLIDGNQSITNVNQKIFEKVSNYFLK